jgi:hypothetical protein
MPTTYDKRILRPGWAGEPEATELEILTKRLTRDRRMASRWGFTRPNSKQTDWAILQVAMWGDPDFKALNSALAHQHFTVNTGVQLPLF